MFSLLRNRSFAALTTTQFLGAFNDNAFKQLVFLLALSAGLPWIAEAGWVGTWGQALAGALFALPFVLFSALTGPLADRFSKRSVMVTANAAEIGVMILGGFAFWSQRYELVLGVVFLMGMQSTLFGPAKYGSIPELTRTSDLSRANGLIQMTTFLAIVIGTALGSLLLDRFSDALLIPAAIYVCFSATGLVASLFIERLPAAAPGRPLEWNPFKELRRQGRLVAGDRPLVLSIVASSFFFLIGATLLFAVNQYGVWLGMEPGPIGLLLTVLSLGIAAGSVLAARLSGDRIESGLIPAGLFGVAVATLAVLISPQSVVWLRICLFFAGMFAGLFSVPIRALIQHRPPADNKGAVLGFSEVLDFVGVFLASGLFALLTGVLGLDPPGVFAVLGGLTLLFTIGSFFYTAEFALRFWLIAMIRGIYRIRARGIDRVPERGGALLVANHLSYVDPFLVSAAIDRPVRFMMFRQFFEMPIIGHFSRLMGAIPVSGHDGPEATREAMERAAELLRQGELVCIFAEGGISRSGNLLGFRRGLQRIARQAGVPIVPVGLDGVWGSIFSFEGGRCFWKLPKRFPYPVDISIGEPLPENTKAWVVRSKVQELISDARCRLAGAKDTLTDAFLRSARGNSRRLAIVDSTGKRLTYRKLLISALAMRSLVRRRFRGEDRLGILLPPGAGAAVCNLAVSLAGKAAINLNYSLGPGALADPIARAGLKHVITSPRFLSALDVEPPLPGEGTVMIEGLAGELSKSDKLRAALTAFLPAWLLCRVVRPVRDPSRTATILFSSGSTGRPKGVVLSHGNILSNVRGAAQALHMHDDDRMIGVLPFFHSFGYTATLWVPLLYGAAVLYHNRPTDAKTIGELAGAEGGTIVLATPTFCQSWMRKITPEQFQQLRLAVAGAEKMPVRLPPAFEERYGTPVLEGYGCTELSPVVAVNLPDLSEVSAQDSGNRLGTVGRPIPGVSTSIRDQERGEELPPGAEGSVWIKGPNVMQGYLEDPERTAEVLRDGWYDTGDVGFVDRDGFLTLTDRRSRFAKIGGEMVPQGRVEEALGEVATHLCLGDRAGSELEEEGEVPRIAVTAVPDDRKGERLVVLHTKLPFEREVLVEQLRVSELPTLYQPRPDQYFEVGEIPQLGSGKTDLKGLRDLALDLTEDK